MMTRQIAAGAFAAAALACGASARAEVISAQPGGFEVQQHAHVAASPDRVWAAIGRVGGWWSPDHTYSRDAANLSLRMEPGGCFCERWAGGAVQHMTVTAVFPGRQLRLEGALGPLGGLGVAGHLTIALKPAADGTDLTLTYDVGGFARDGLDRLAGPVDGVLALQTERLARFAAAGRP